MSQWAELCVTDRWEQWGRQRWEGVLEDWAQGSLGHPHTWPDAATGVWRLLLHARYYIPSINTHAQTCTHAHVNTRLTQLGRTQHSGWLWRKGHFYYTLLLVFLVLCPKWPMHFPLMLCSLHSSCLGWRTGAGMCVCVCQRCYLAWTQSFKIPWNCVH